MSPLSWRSKLARRLAHDYYVETITFVLGVFSGAYGVAILTVPETFLPQASFQQALRLVPFQWWGIIMIVLAVSMVTLLTHSRAAAAIATSLLGIVWLLWVIPIILSPGFAPSALIVYAALFAVTIITGAACTVPREERPDD